MFFSFLPSYILDWHTLEVRVAKLSNHKSIDAYLLLSSFSLYSRLYINSITI